MTDRARKPPRRPASAESAGSPAQSSARRRSSSRPSHQLSWKAATRRAARWQAVWEADSSRRSGPLAAAMVRRPPANGPARFHRRRWIIAGATVAVVVVALGVAGLLSVPTLKDAKNELTQAKDLLQRVADDPSSLLSHSGRAADGALLGQAANLARQAHDQLTSSLPVSFVGLFPILHTQTAGAVQLAADAETASHLARHLIDDVDSLSGSATINDGQVPLGPLSTLHAEVVGASTTMSGLVRSPGGLIGPLATARSLFDSTASKVSGRLSNAAEDLIAARTFLGAAGPRNYLIVGENNAEMRDQGMPLSYSSVAFTHGRFQTGPHGDTGEIEPTTPVPIPLSPGGQLIFGGLSPTLLWQNANATADFPWSASVMAAMYTQVTGVPVDGVIAADVPALSRLLAVIGPVTVPGIDTPLTSANAGDVLLNRLYVQAQTGNSQAQRRDQVAAAISAVFTKLQGGSVADIVDFGDALAKSAAGGHLMVWSTHKSEEGAFVHTGAGGDVAASDPARTIHVAVENATSTKLDYFVHPSVDVHVKLTAQGSALITVSVQVANQAPVGAAPSYQLGPDNFNSSSPGQYVARVYFWGPSGGIQPSSVRDSGLRLNQIPVKVDAGGVGTVQFSTSIPDAVRYGTLDLRFVPQPRLFPDDLTVSLDAPAWRITSGAPKSSYSWDTTTTLDWGLVKR